MAIYIGVDLSLRSPGLSIYNPLKKTFNNYFFPQRKREIKFSFSQNITVHKPHTVSFDFSIKPISHASDSNDKCGVISKYKFISEQLINVIESEIVDINKKHVCVRIEGYAFNAKSSSCSKLHELGGIFKYLLYCRNINFEEISPTKLKKTFSGKGNANKEYMYEVFKKHGFPELMSVFHIKNVKSIPNPVQDIVDSVALVMSFFYDL